MQDLTPYRLFIFFCWLLARIVGWRRQRIVEHEARYQAEIEMRTREIIREKEERDR